ncbi:AAA family ATPase [Clostridiaceae bacterium UIB06]|uniref:AAA family ATPase n=1 Tax=Clostridium thailandense TaxID=2794346 RepID=A0A949TNH7_9CLOT|nr:UvrD-helicase domain-containing protein [Clostridium thailandense]MBV7272517.1 AAA family ATPase [Clostridium thailandense]MCH5138081.1 AAA family ATPase [Clostridiaceae bacterium UIB06]
MSDFKQNQEEETLYLKKTLNVIKKELQREEDALKNKFSDVVASRKEMWEESVHFSEDFDRIPEMNHFLSEVNMGTKDYISTERRIQRYNKMMKSPYFGRFDFIEESFDDVEKIYIGLYNLMDSDNDDILVYDWRAPISSIFYRCELGKGSYKSPVGIINGDILLKRQYKIKDCKLKYFFDSSIRINDEILQEVLSRSASSKMRSIVETIQKEQDLIIRDTENELLIVQGVAGSGKTSIALHRIAFLLYEGLNSRLGINNVIIISPNSIFSKYISDVLPELGEENVEQITFDDIILKFLGKRFSIESRQIQLETLVTLKDEESFSSRIQSIQFKGSDVFHKVLDRLIEYYEKNLIDFRDIYYDGEIIETRQEIKNFFLINKIDMPISKRLKRIENMILNKIHPLREKRLEKIERVVEKSGNHILEIKPFSRLLAIKEANRFMKHLHSFTEIDYMLLYKLLFSKKELLVKLSEGLQLPETIDKIAEQTNKNFEKGYISYEDCAALLYIKLKLEGIEEFSEIKQVVVDEAQDYYPLQYQIFKLLFKGARYTILGDFNQTIEKCGNKNLYDDIEEILDKRKSVKIFMNKSYRSSVEINLFSQKLLNRKCELVSFERHEAEPKVLHMENRTSMDQAIASDINKCFEKGYESIAVICKTMQEACDIEQRLKELTKVAALKDADTETKGCAFIIPAYLAKGLEFDVVIIYDACAEKYKNDFDRRLLYVACTRTLHELSIYYTGEKSFLI